MTVSRSSNVIVAVSGPVVPCLQMTQVIAAASSPPAPQEFQTSGHLFLSQPKTEVREPAEEHTDGQLIGQDDARMGSPLAHHLLVQPGKIATTYSSQFASMSASMSAWWS